MSELLVLLVLTLITAFFAMSEIAIVQASRPLLKQMAKQGSKRAVAALALLEDTGRALSTLQVGLTLVGVLAGAYGGATIANNITPYLVDLPFVGQWAGHISLTIVVVILTYLEVVIGELVPKQYALAHPEKLALMAAYPMTVASNIGKPVVWIFNKSADLLLAVLGVPKGGHGNVTEDEVHAVLSEGAESGAIDKAEYDIFRRLMAFSDREVKSIMTPRGDVVTIDIHDDMEKIRNIISTSNHSRYPVIENSLDKCKGLVTAFELLEEGLRDGPFDIAKVTKEIPHLSENTPCHRVLEQFKNNPVDLALVVDEYGTIIGIVTTADILEAIVGSVASNYDDNQHTMVQRDDESWLVDGMTSTDDIVLTVGVDGMNDDDSYTTLSGFILHELGRTPEVGEHFDALEHRFEIMDLDERRIDKVLISRVSTGMVETVSAEAAVEALEPTAH